MATRSTPSARGLIHSGLSGVYRAMNHWTSAVLFASSALLAAPMQAQQGSGNGFLFGRPSWRLSIQGGFASPTAQSDIFDFVTDELTLGRSDFAGGTIGLSLAGTLTPRIELGVDVDYAGRTADSESRLFEGDDDLPILQTTQLQRVPIMASARFLLRSPGRSIGRYAWIPARLVPFVGASAGAVWYRFKQEGEFVDRETLDIFQDRFESKGWTPAARAHAGANLTLTPRLGITGEGRYLFARGAMKGDFSSFNKIDLSGYDASIGFYVRF